MINPHKGEVAFTADERRYVLHYSIDAICALEESAGKGFPALVQEMADPDKMSVSLLRKVLWAGLREHHPDLTLKDAGELILGAGGMVGLFPHIERAIAAAFPAATESGDARPQ
ncbi:MAG: hypothetical protein GEU91_18475 [Rhizobiales bacterium]|nr:hypothetical protein [Hyphomicrobiales bacterium]